MKAMFLVLAFMALLYACESNSKSKTIAKVYEFELTEEDLKHEALRKSENLDSGAFTESFIKKWINQMVVIHHANLESGIDINEINKKVDDYKNQLLVHFYENEVIKRDLDTIVKEETIKDYYQKNKIDFQLKDYLVKVLYLKVSEDAPDLNKVANWYRLNGENDAESIIKYASMYATNFYFDQTNWIYFDEITKEIPLTDINKDRFITKKGDIKFNEEGYIYFLNIIDYKLKNAVSPIEFEKDNIKQRILNARILQLRKKINTDLIQKAENENAIKRY